MASMLINSAYDMSGVVLACVGCPVIAFQLTWNVLSMLVAVVA